MPPDFLCSLSLPIYNECNKLPLRFSNQALSYVIEVCYSREENFVITRAQGRLKMADLLAFHDSMDELNVSANHRSLADCRNADLSALSTADITRNKQRGIEVAVRAGGNYRFALVVSGPLDFGLGRMYEMIDERDELSMRVFRKYNEAIEWVGVKKEVVDRLSASFVAPVLELP